MNENPLSLDDFADLLVTLDAPYQDTGPSPLGDEVSAEARAKIQALEREVQGKPYAPVSKLNELRHLYLQAGDMARSMYFVNRIVEFHGDDPYTVKVLADWHLDSDPPAAFRALLEHARYPLPLVRMMCLLKAGEIALTHRRFAEAKQLFEAAKQPVSAVEGQFFLRHFHSKAEERLREVEAAENAAACEPGPQTRPTDGRFNPITPRQEEHLRNLIEKHGLSTFAERIVSLAQPCICFDEAPGREAVIGGTRLGGLPDVPPGWEWPENLPFIGQFNLEEMAPHDPNGLLPRRGLLSFFYYQQGYNDQEDGRERRVFFSEDVASLQRAKAPRGFLPIELSEEPHCIFKTLSVAPRGTISLPVTYSRWWGEMYEDEESAFNDDGYMALLDELRPLHGNGGRNQVLGHHTFMDGDADEQAWEASVSVSPRLIGQQIDELAQADTINALDRNIQHHREAAKGAGMEHNERMAAYYQKKRDDYVRYLKRKEEADRELQEWILLFQIDSDDRIGTMFSDAGFAFFMIRKADFADARFDRVYAGMWTS